MTSSRAGSASRRAPRDVGAGGGSGNEAEVPLPLCFSLKALLRNIGAAPTDDERAQLFYAAVCSEASDIVFDAGQAQQLLEDPRVGRVGLTLMEKLAAICPRVVSKAGAAALVEACLDSQGKASLRKYLSAAWRPIVGNATGESGERASGRAAALYRAAERARARASSERASEHAVSSRPPPPSPARRLSRKATTS